VMPADADLIAPPGLMWIWAAHVKGAQWTVVPAAGHAIAWEQPERFTENLLRFFRGREPFTRVADVPRP
jgi:pimeloyl-ACP methyl ester carboxylesterase